MSKEKFKSKIGGQALIEGIMMLGPTKGAMACRLPDGTIDLETWDENNGKKAPWYKKAPFIRGCFNFVSSLIKGYKYTMKSAEKQMTEEDEEEQLSGTATDIIMVIGSVLGVIMAMGLFFVLPKFLVGLIPGIADMGILRSVLEGIVKIALFVLYMWAVSLMKDIKRQYMYHGAEHKTIACHEAELPLTVENVRKQTRFHKRCGTSFIFIVLIIGIFVMCFVPKGLVWWQRSLVSIITLPLVVSISYECIRLAGTHDNLFTKILSAPGLAMQRITTREPDDSMIEIAITALKECIPEDKEEDKW
ncbi:MAG: DUF1385 domain-containing protein [Ruminococcus flavefaciens]|nr:DUF1385 domain-containing protein [Ruminococcus flavefaciens]MCM1228757.1 DUF1385 domain-containing protein [Ruminococcus flavefaciens]